VVSNRLLFVTEALRQLLQDDNFSTLLRAEGLTTFPKPLAGLMERKDIAMAKPPPQKPNFPRPRSRLVLTATIDLRIDQIVRSKSFPCCTQKPEIPADPASIREVGIIEPPVVSRDPQSRKNISCSTAICGLRR
jgi:hypothetical protein